ncbi:hypothetical protein ACRALDRAFT_210000, partial [Sodiomyces alcalophilus JCM 7366]|uniref:uncharacterized protein n=1 Tax=Sodiomyces alcalophilus JCM 7366 TaxID=591952 RepID=UPI0039B608E0
EHVHAVAWGFKLSDLLVLRELLVQRRRRAELEHHAASGCSAGQPLVGSEETALICSSESLSEEMTEMGRHLLSHTTIYCVPHMSSASFSGAFIWWYQSQGFVKAGASSPHEGKSCDALLCPRSTFLPDLHSFVQSHRILPQDAGISLIEGMHPACLYYLCLATENTRFKRTLTIVAHGGRDANTYNVHQILRGPSSHCCSEIFPSSALESSLRTTQFLRLGRCFLTFHLIPRLALKIRGHGRNVARTQSGPKHAQSLSPHLLPSRVRHDLSRLTSSISSAHNHCNYESTCILLTGSSAHAVVDPSASLTVVDLFDPLPQFKTKITINTVAYNVEMNLLIHLPDAINWPCSSGQQILISSRRHSKLDKCETMPNPRRGLQSNLTNSPGSSREIIAPFSLAQAEETTGCVRWLQQFDDKSIAGPNCPKTLLSPLSAQTTVERTYLWCRFPATPNPASWLELANAGRPGVIRTKYSILGRPTRAGRKKTRVRPSQSLRRRAPEIRVRETILSRERLRALSILITSKLGSSITTYVLIFISLMTSPHSLCACLGDGRTCQSLAFTKLSRLRARIA